jgi:hypothetical protein
VSVDRTDQRLTTKAAGKILRLQKRRKYVVGVGGVASGKLRRGSRNKV